MSIINGANGVAAVKPYEGSITLNKSSIVLNEAGDTFQLTATTDPLTLINKGLTWTSSDNSIATVSSSGLVTCIEPGECTITVMTNSKRYTATCSVAQGWAPGANTKIYLPLTDDYKDAITGTTLSTTGTVSLTTEGGIKCTRVNGGQLYGLQSSIITGNGARTLSFWFNYYSVDTANWGSVVSWGSESNYSFTSLGDDGTNYAFSGYSSSADIQSSTPVSAGEWYHMVATYTGSVLTIYLNGVLIGTKSVNLTTGSSNLYIGGRPSGSCKVNGFVNEVIVEDKAWTAEEIKDYYDLTKGTYHGTIEDFDLLEYIESSGTQRIDTGVIPTQNTISQIKFRNLASTGDVIYGMYNGSDSTDYRFFNASTYAYFDMGSGRINNSTSNTIAVGTDYELELGNFYVKNLSTGTNILSGTAQGSYTGGRTITLNYSNNSGASQNRWYYVKIRDGQTQVRDFIPVQRKSDGVIGLWDNVNGDFYTNKGSGTFIAGPRLGVSISPSSVSLTTAGQTATLTAVPNPSSVGAQGYVWTSSDTSIATVAQATSTTATVTCVTPGTCTITCTAVATGDTATCDVVTIEEYVLLSEGGDINRYSELAKSSNNTYTSLHDNGTTWRAQVTTTDKCTSMYKNFDKDIVKFEIKFQYTENYSYSGVYFILQPTVGDADLGSSGYFEVNNGQDTYSGWSGIKLYRGTTSTNYYPSSGVSTADITVVGEKVGNTWTLTFTGGKNFTYTFEETDNCRRISFGGWRWWTGTQGYFKKVVVYLQ